ncbi:MAG: hypothetical protein K2W95_28815 [Candidatus Obscuribacterales bacterium]|nr:hypothetical protein [Candidatus Obscuribacterales bacterium]
MPRTFLTKTLLLLESSNFMVEAFMFLIDLVRFAAILIGSSMVLSPLKRLMDRAFETTGVLWVFLWGTFVAFCAAAAAGYYFGSVLQWGLIGWVFAPPVVFCITIGAFWPMVCVAVIAPAKSCVQRQWKRYHEYNRKRGVVARRSLVIDYTLIFAFTCIVGAVGVQLAPVDTRLHELLGLVGMTYLVIGLAVALEIVKGCRETVYSIVILASGVVALGIIVQVGNGSPWFLLASLIAPALAMCLVLPDEALPTLPEEEPAAQAK